MSSFIGAGKRHKARLRCPVSPPPPGAVAPHGASSGILSQAAHHKLLPHQDTMLIRQVQQANHPVWLEPTIQPVQPPHQPLVCLLTPDTKHPISAWASRLHVPQEHTNLIRDKQIAWIPTQGTMRAAQGTPIRHPARKAHTSIPHKLLLAHQHHRIPMQMERGIPTLHLVHLVQPPLVKAPHLLMVA